MRCAEPTYHSQFIAKCQIDCVVSVSEPGVTGGNHSATEEQHGSPCRRYGRAPLRLTASRPDRALRSSSFCLLAPPTGIPPCGSGRASLPGIPFGPPNKALRLTAALLGAFPLAPGVPRPKRGEGETKCTSTT
jgi:hypothetical protein